MLKLVLRFSLLSWLILIGLLFAFRSLGNINPAPILSYISSTSFNNADIMLTDISQGMRVNLTNSPSVNDGLLWSLDGRYLFYRSSRATYWTYFALDTQSWGSRLLVSFVRDTRVSGIGYETVSFYDSYSFEDIYISLKTGQRIPLSDVACQPPNCFSMSNPPSQLSVSLLDDAVYAELQVIDWETMTPVSFEQLPVWSADTSAFVFRSNLQGWSDIYFSTAKGGFARRLTNSSEFEDSLAWSYDGRWISYTQFVNGRSDVFVLELATGQIWNISNHQRADFEPSWQP